RADPENTAHLVEEPPFPGLPHLRARQPELALELQDLAPRHAQQRDLDVMAAGQCLELWHRAGRRADDETPGRLAEERRFEAKRRLRPQRWAPHAQAAEQAALRERDEHAALGAVVRRAKLAGLGSGQ